MTTQPDRSVLLIFRQAPYGKTLARDALDVALASAAFIPNLAVLFMGDGVFQLKPDQISSGIGAKNHAATVEALPVYGVENIYLYAPSALERGLDAGSTVIDCQLVQDDELPALIARFDQVLSF